MNKYCVCPKYEHVTMTFFRLSVLHDIFHFSFPWSEMSLEVKIFQINHNQLIQVCCMLFASLQFMSDHGEHQNEHDM